MPIYFFRYFGLKHGLIKTLNTLGIFLIAAVCYAIPYAIKGTTPA